VAWSIPQWYPIDAQIPIPCDPVGGGAWRFGGDVDAYEGNLRPVACTEEETTEDSTYRAATDGLVRCQKLQRVFAARRNILRARRAIQGT
jgi:hypothetical protein